MRNLHLKFFAAALAFSAAACARVDAPGPAAGDGYGTLDLSSIAVDMAATRAVPTGNFIVRVRPADSQDGEDEMIRLLSECDGTIELPAGRYLLEVCSPGERRLAVWEDDPSYVPWYRGEAAFNIEKGATTGIGGVVCKLGYIKATIHYGETLLETLEKTGAKTTVTVGGGSLEYPFGERRGGFFSADGTADISVRFEGVIVGSPTTYTETVAGVPSAEWVRLFIDLEKEDGGTMRLMPAYGSEIGQIDDGDNWF